MFEEMLKEYREVFEALPLVAVVIIVTLFVMVGLGRGLDLLAKHTNLRRLSMRPFENLVRYLIMLAALVVVVEIMGFNIGGLWTALSAVLAMVAIGFVAVWSVLSNSMCTLLILITRPFQVGDVVEFAGETVKGRVVDLNLIFTTLKDEEGYFYQVPNNMFFQKVIRRKAGARTPVSLAEQLSSSEMIEEQAEDSK